MIMAIVIWTQSNEVNALPSQVIEKPILNKPVDNASEQTMNIVENSADLNQQATIDDTANSVNRKIEEVNNPIIEVIYETSDSILSEPTIEVVDETVEPVIDVVDEVIEPIIKVVDETIEPAIEEVSETADLIVKVEEESTQPITSNGWSGRLIPFKAEQEDSIPIPIKRPIAPNSSNIVLNNNVINGTGSSTSDQNGFSNGNVIGFIKGQGILSKSLIVTRNYANDFILINQWSNAPPGQPPKVTSSQPHKN
jgi:hypothetical protein